MKWFLMAAFSLVFLTGAREATAQAQGLLNSVRVAAPQGEVFLYYREGELIVIKNCIALTILGATPAQAKSRCQGTTNKVSVDNFKEMVRNSISTQGIKYLKPLTAKEIEAYKKSGTSSENLAKMIAEVDKINAFIKAYGKENAPMVRLDELNRDLEFNKTRAKAIQRINKEIEKAISLIIDEKQLKIVDAKTDDCNGITEKPFLYTVLKKLDDSKIPCGLKGSAEQRALDCSKLEGSKKGNFTLVARTAEGLKVYKDNKSGLLWGDRLSKEMSRDDALKACKSDLAEVANISGVKWRLPTADEHDDAQINGADSVMPAFIEPLYWASSVAHTSARLYGTYRSDNFRTKGFVQCVAVP